MKTLLTLFVLLFSSSVVAEDISDLKIDGIGLYENLSNHYSEIIIKKEVKKYIDKYAKFGLDHSFIELSFWGKSDYEALAYFIKPEDPEYIIWGINGKKRYININKCFDEKDNIEKQISYVFPDTKKSYYNGPHNLDPSGKSTVESTFILLQSGINIELTCYDFDRSMQKQGENWDHFAIYIDSKELLLWLPLPN